MKKVTRKLMGVILAAAMIFAVSVSVSAVETVPVEVDGFTVNCAETIETASSSCRIGAFYGFMEVHNKTFFGLFCNSIDQYALYYCATHSNCLLAVYIQTIGGCGFSCPW